MNQIPEVVELPVPDVHWLIEPEVFGDDAEKLVTVLEQSGLYYTISQFGKSYEDYVNKFSKDDCVIFYGSLQFARVLQRKAPWVPGVYCNLPSLEAKYYYPRFGDHLLNSEYVMLPYGDIYRRKDFLFDTLSKDGKLFIRPNSCFKTFTGFVVSEADFSREISFLKCRMNPEDLVVVSSPAQVGREWRFVVAKNRIITGSLYKHGEDTTRSGDVPQEVVEYSQGVLDSIIYYPDPMWTLDVCETDAGLRVLEVGSFSCAGLYDCDMQKVVETTNQVAVQDWQESYVYY